MNDSQAEPSDEILILEGKDVRRLPARPFRAGLFGETLEAALQALIERHPEVLPGRQMDLGSEDPPRFVLLRREMPVAGWSLDHLLADQRAVLTLVETKLAENPEARREVIGQIMEYAANARMLWGGGRARELAEEYWQRREGKPVDEVIREGLGVDAEKFWALLERNLREGRIRLIVAADELTPEVRRIIEYLNEEMETAEIFGLEIQCFGEKDGGTLVFVPRLVGQTQAAADRKAGTGSPPAWPPDKLREAYKRSQDAGAGVRLLKLLDWAVDGRIFLEARAKNPVFGLRGRSGDRVFTFLPDGSVYWFMNERHYPDGARERDLLLNKLRKLGMVPQDLDPNMVSAGRNLVRKLDELSSEQFSSLMEVLGQACGG